MEISEGVCTPYNDQMRPIQIYGMDTRSRAELLIKMIESTKESISNYVVRPITGDIADGRA